jgi:hypothetical protein
MTGVFPHDGDVSEDFAWESPGRYADPSSSVLFETASGFTIPSLANGENGNFGSARAMGNGAGGEASGMIL